MSRLFVFLLVLMSIQNVFAESCNFSEVGRMLWRMPLSINTNASSWQNKYLGEYQYFANNESVNTTCYGGGEFSFDISRDGTTANISAYCNWGYVDSLSVPELQLRPSAKQKVFDLVYKDTIVGKFDSESQIVWNLKREDGFFSSGVVNFTCEHGASQISGDFKMNYTREDDYVNFQGRMNKDLSK